MNPLPQKSSFANSRLETREQEGRGELHGTLDGMAAKGLQGLGGLFQFCFKATLSSGLARLPQTRLASVGSEAAPLPPRASP